MWYIRYMYLYVSVRICMYLCSLRGCIKCIFACMPITYRHIHTHMDWYICILKCISACIWLFFDCIFRTYIHIWITYALYVSDCIWVHICLYLRPVSAPISAPVSAPVSTPVSAPVSARLHRRLRGHIAVASQHRIGGASHRSTKRRRLANFIRITYASGSADSLYTDWRSGAWTTAGSGRSDDEDICWSHGREVVTRWSSKSYAMHRPMDV